MLRDKAVAILKSEENVKVIHWLFDGREFIYCKGLYQNGGYIMKDCNSCKYFWYDNSTGASECGQYDNMTEDETEKYYMNGEDDCPFYDEDTN